MFDKNDEAKYYKNMQQHWQWKNIKLHKTADIYNKQRIPYKKDIAKINSS